MNRCIVVLSGKPGTGKTVAAVWLAMHRLAQDGVLFMTGPELARLPRYGDEREELLEASNVIVDDLGAERADAKFAADFDELVDRCYQALQWGRRSSPTEIAAVHVGIEVVTVASMGPSIFTDGDARISAR